MNTLGPAGKTVIVLVVLALGAAVWYVSGSPLPPAGPVACTMEAKLCPDGSAVGRTGPNCEFAACPGEPGAGGGDAGGTITGTVAYKSGISGVVLAGPTCPVERDPPDPACADKPIATNINVSRAGSTQIFAQTKSNASGEFSFSLPPGDYVVSGGGNPLPRCNDTPATVGPGVYTRMTLGCDTGIR